MSNHYVTRFGSLQDYEKGRVEPIDDDVKTMLSQTALRLPTIMHLMKK